MKKQTHTTDLHLYLHAAIELGLQHRIIDEETFHAHIFNDHKQMRVVHNNLSLNLKSGVSQSIRKGTTSRLLQSKSIPSPMYKVFTDQPEALKFALAEFKKGHSIVIKPNASSQDKGVTVKPSTQAQIRTGIREAFEAEGDKKVIIEEYISGELYRITVLDGEIIAITRRHSAHVIGDGIHNVGALIKQKNITRKNEGHPAITLSYKDHDYLRSKHISLTDIYAKGKHVRLQHGCLYGLGGSLVRVDTDTVPQVNQAMFIRAIQTIGLRFGGIDYISPNICTPYTQIKTAINEINSAPYQEVHYYDSSPNNNYAAKRIIEKLFEKDGSMAQ